MIKDFSVVNNTIQIRKILRVLGEDFASSQSPNSRKGGLIGLAAVAIALGKVRNPIASFNFTTTSCTFFAKWPLPPQETSMYIDELIHPVLNCFTDSDSRVRYHACEALYNISKVARGSILVFFNKIFDALSIVRICFPCTDVFLGKHSRFVENRFSFSSQLAADPDHSVRNGCELLDHLLKVCMIFKFDETLQVS